MQFYAQVCKLAIAETSVSISGVASYFSVIPCSDAVGWVARRTSGLYKPVPVIPKSSLSE